MARLPSERYLIQQIGGQVVLYEGFTEREIVRFDPSDANAAARAQHTIHLSELSEEDKCFAHFWSGYFYAHAVSPWSKPGDDDSVHGGIYVDPVGVLVSTQVNTAHLHEHDQTRAEDKTYESRLH